MSRGTLMYAFNNESIDYIKMAVCNALLLKKHMENNAVALVTDQHTYNYGREQLGEEMLDRCFDHVVIDKPIADRKMTRKFHDTRYSSFTDKYYNLNRVQAYDATPFEETLLLDADYLVLDDAFDACFGSAEDMLCNTKTLDLDYQENRFGDNNHLSDMSIPLYWATALYFRKSEKAKMLFELISFIRDNYEFYQHLYGFNHSGYFRNDFALSIAIHMTNNFMEYGGIKPLPIDHILVSLENDEMHAFQDGHPIFSTESQPGDFKLRRIISSVHVMNKRSILRNMDGIVEYATA